MKSEFNVAVLFAAIGYSTPNAMPCFMRMP